MRLTTQQPLFGWQALDDSPSLRTIRALLAAVLVVHAGLATLLASSPRRDGPLGKLRLSAIAQALQARQTA